MEVVLPLLVLSVHERETVGWEVFEVLVDEYPNEREKELLVVQLV